eukprot:218471-Chlamydomonas_euryale.AAC.1
MLALAGGVQLPQPVGLSPGLGKRPTVSRSSRRVSPSSSPPPPAPLLVTGHDVRRRSRRLLISVLHHRRPSSGDGGLRGVAEEWGPRPGAEMTATCAARRWRPPAPGHQRSHPRCWRERWVALARPRRCHARPPQRPRRHSSDSRSGGIGGSRDVPTQVFFCSGDRAHHRLSSTHGRPFQSRLRKISALPSYEDGLAHKPLPPSFVNGLLPSPSPPPHAGREHPPSCRTCLSDAIGTKSSVRDNRRRMDATAAAPSATLLRAVCHGCCCAGGCCCVETTTEPTVVDGLSLPSAAAAAGGEAAALASPICA